VIYEFKLKWCCFAAVLAVGTRGCSVNHYNMEKGQVGKEFVADASVTCLAWAKLEEGEDR